MQKTDLIVFIGFRLASISRLIVCFVLPLVFLNSNLFAKPSLKGSAASLDRQNRAANRASLKRHQTPKELMRTVQQGKLIRIQDGKFFELHNVSYPYAHPQLKDFLVDFAKIMRRECGINLVITSLARPISTQPKNASSRSVHPTGIAADLRLPPQYCRKKIEPILLQLEHMKVIEATRERRPPHYHVSINPVGYLEAIQSGNGSLQITSPSHSKAQQKEFRVTQDSIKKHKKSKKRKRIKQHKVYRVKSGDTLWDLAQKWNVTVQAIQRTNQLKSSRIDLGQNLKIP